MTYVSMPIYHTKQAVQIADIEHIGGLRDVIICFYDKIHLCSNCNSDLAKHHRIWSMDE